jgi:hypothetical protein
MGARRGDGGRDFPCGTGYEAVSHACCGRLPPQPMREQAKMRAGDSCNAMGTLGSHAHASNIRTNESKDMLAFFATSDANMHEKGFEGQEFFSARIIRPRIYEDDVASAWP